MSQGFVSVHEKDGKYLLSLIGPLDENMSFKNIRIEGVNEIRVDFEQVDGIKSFGIRELIRWLNVHRAARILYSNCPKIVVDQINIVDGFLPQNATVESFYVPYYCEVSGEESKVLFRYGIEFDGSNITPPDQVKDSKGNLMEMDVIWTKYFRFLEGKHKRLSS